MCAGDFATSFCIEAEQPIHANARRYSEHNAGGIGAGNDPVSKPRDYPRPFVLIGGEQFARRARK